jgi:nicotinamide-nucleotide adenylyltransferase
MGNTMSDNSLYVGRFRLFHKGYLEVVKHILSAQSGALTMAIGAAQTSHNADNPFSGEERAEMLMSALREENLSHRVHVVQIDETYATFEDWTSLVQSICPPFELVYCNDELVRLLFQKAGYATSPVPQFSDGEYSFHRIVNRMLDHKPWEGLLPNAVVRIIKERGLEQRLGLKSLSERFKV